VLASESSSLQPFSPQDLPEAHLGRCHFSTEVAPKLPEPWGVVEFGHGG
jgi:hypothetical protein